MHARIPVDLAKQRKIALMFVATGSIFTGIGSILGMLMIFGRSLGVSIMNFRTFSVHPYLQIFGFLAEFVFGVAYSLVPSLKSHGLPSYTLAFVSYGLITVANAGFLASVWGLPPGVFSNTAFYLSMSLEIIASLIFLYEMSFVLRHGRKSMVLGDGYILLSAVSFPTASISVVISSILGLDTFSFGIIYLLLVGFVGSMIFGVTMKTVAIRFTVNMGKTYPYAVYAQMAAVFASASSIYLTYSVMPELVSGLFFVSAALFIISSRTLSQSRLLIPTADRKAAHLGNTRGHGNLVYVEAALISASAWLITGVLFSALYSITGYFWIRIAFIHSFSIGFIGSTIIGIAPVLLPGILSRNAPSGENSSLPLYLLNAGLIIFVAGDIIASGNVALPFWTGLGGVVIILSMLVFMYDIHKNLISKKSRDETRTSFSDDW